MFISIWVLLFTEGIFQGFLGVSLYAITFLISAKRGNLFYVLLVFLPVGLALDFILFLPIGSNWILISLIYFVYLLVERILHGASGISLFVTTFITFIVYYLLRASIIFVAEGGKLVEYINWDMIGHSVFVGLISSILFVLIGGFLDLIAKPKDRVLKIK